MTIWFANYGRFPFFLLKEMVSLLQYGKDANPSSFCNTFSETDVEAKKTRLLLSSPASPSLSAYCSHFFCLCWNKRSWCGSKSVTNGKRAVNKERSEGFFPSWKKLSKNKGSKSKGSKSKGSKGEGSEIERSKKIPSFHIKGFENLLLNFLLFFYVMYQTIFQRKS